MVNYRKELQKLERGRDKAYKRLMHIDEEIEKMKQRIKEAGQ